MVGYCADARYVWNLALEQANLYRPHWGATPNAAVRQRQLAEARKVSWLGEGSSSVQQQALRDFDPAMRNWWGGAHCRPRWRRRFQHEGFCIRDVVVRELNCRWATVKVTKLGPVRFRLSLLGGRGVPGCNESLPASGRGRIAGTRRKTGWESAPTVRRTVGRTGWSRPRSGWSARMT